jgi:hypothetical protein
MNNRKITLGRMAHREANTPAGLNLTYYCNSTNAVNRVLNEINKIKKGDMAKKIKANVLARAQWDLKRKLGLPVSRLY